MTAATAAASWSRRSSWRRRRLSKQIGHRRRKEIPLSIGGGRPRRRKLGQKMITLKKQQLHFCLATSSATSLLLLALFLFLGAVGGSSREGNKDQSYKPAESVAEIWSLKSPSQPLVKRLKSSRIKRRGEIATVIIAAAVIHTGCTKSNGNFR